jgi:hypothetical protein
MMLVPFADNCNHFCVENYFELFNARLTRKALRRDAVFNNHENQYFTKNKKKINFLKHFKEDDEKENDDKSNVSSKDQSLPTLPTLGGDESDEEKVIDPGSVGFSSMRYYKKLLLREECEAIEP